MLKLKDMNVNEDKERKDREDTVVAVVEDGVEVVQVEVQVDLVVEASVVVVQEEGGKPPFFFFFLSLFLCFLCCQVTVF
jgi:hypothetical protein